MPHSYLSFDLYVEVIAPFYVTGERADEEFRLSSVHSAALASRTRHNDLRRRLGPTNMAEVQAESAKAAKGDGPMEATVDVLVRFRARGIRNKASGNVRLANVQGDGRAAQVGGGLLRLLGEPVLEDVRAGVVSALEGGTHHLEARRAGRVGRAR